MNIMLTNTKSQNLEGLSSEEYEFDWQILCVEYEILLSLLIFSNQEVDKNGGIGILYSKDLTQLEKAI